MKKSIVFSAIFALVCSCSQLGLNEIESFRAPDIKAIAESDGDTKTTLSVNLEGVGTILWIPKDEINIFYGSTGTRYVSQNTENAEIAEFTTSDKIGSAELASTNRWGLYPYNSSATCDGSYVTTTLPAEQKGVKGTFDDHLFITLAHSANNDYAFKNVCGGIKLSLSRGDIQKITFKGNNNENLAGQVKLSMGSDGKPTVSAVVSGEKEITLTPKSGTTFASGSNYYIISLPVSLSKGFTMTLETETHIGTFKHTGTSVKIKRGVFGVKANIDKYATFVAKYDGEAVDLGLSVKWGSCNVRAKNPEDYGERYSWGETAAKSNYSWKTYELCEGTEFTLTKYVPVPTEIDYGTIDHTAELDPEDDVAHIICGGKWRMPKAAEWQELMDKCTWTWTQQNGVNGYLVSCWKGCPLPSKFEQ
ncbi:MAG: hypothetical protein ACI3Y4_01160 [Candidatus Cryptobacteroides sp.]